jgi:methylmalonyl-CoA/ethylmalonyl-CoA epimerase
VPESPNRLDHVAFGVPAVADVVPLVVSQLGGREREAGPGGGFRWWQWEFAGGGALEILEPDGPPGGFLHRFLASRGPGPHHVTFKVPDLYASIDQAKLLGYEVVGLDDRDPYWREAFLHPKQAQGIVVQFAESNPRPADAEPWPGPEWPFPELPPERPDPARCVGIRLACKSLEAARMQWETLLGGTPTPEGEGVVYRWPESPLRIRVFPEPTRPEGPVALEFSADRALALPEGPHPIFGVPFVQIEAPSA